MGTVTLSAALRQEYERLFDACTINAARATQVLSLVDKLVANRARYQAVAKRSGVPWHFVAVTHNMESSQNFSKHLHNGDPLNARTVQVPAGRPRTGTPPFTWEESAADALALKGLNAQTDWSLAGILYRLEGYNGWGYRRFHPQVLSPYLWGFSNHYLSGKYVKDGVWSDSAVSQQCGAAVLLRRMAERGHIQLAPTPAAAAVPAYSTTKPKDRGMLAQVEALQTWLNSFPHIFLKIDGVPGKRTAQAYRQVTGKRLPGDPN